MKRKQQKKTSTGLNKISTLNKILIVFAVVAVLVLLFVLLRPTPAQPFQVQTVPYDFVIKQSVGINADTDMLHFGGAPAGNSAIRLMSLSSPQDSLVKIRFQGPGSILVSDNNFILSAGENKDLNFTFTYPDLPEGNYSGMVYFEFYPVD
jgi:hypothetical protein